VLDDDLQQRWRLRGVEPFGENVDDVVVEVVEEARLPVVVLARGVRRVE
jgi:hypothetical protein